ncbi:hypothetical protein F4781DRAFT_430379 [Annulohypoxylon bovei var. microspora]|nr:hypothetical protein F4781DRAFT_430379 [Annulohypoxylon bovei var. microspora]
MASYNQVPEVQSGFDNSTAASPQEPGFRIFHTTSLHVAHFGHSSNSPALICTECSKTFKTNDELRKHGAKERHDPYGCVCGTKFTRLDALNRHITTQSPNTPQYPCEYCYDRQGESGFNRLDHLAQHLKNYHRIETADKLLQSKPNESRVPVATTMATVPMPFATSGPGIFTPLIPTYPGAGIGCPAWGSNEYFGFDEHQAMMNPYDVGSYPIVQNNPDPTMQQFQQDGRFGFMQGHEYAENGTLTLLDE